jgi:hypothetical protein
LELIPRPRRGFSAIKTSKKLEREKNEMKSIQLISAFWNYKLPGECHEFRDTIISEKPIAWLGKIVFSNTF